MIAVDTSARMAIVLGEAEAATCMNVPKPEAEVLISAGTVAEALIVAARRNVTGEMAKLINGLGFNVVSVTSASAPLISDAYEPWGKGCLHPAGLNFGDCVSYKIAKENGCRLLFVGNDFARTDLESAS